MSQWTKRSLQIKARNAVRHQVHFQGCLFLSRHLTIENFAELTGTVSVTSVVKASQLDGSTAEDEREKVKTDLSKLKAKCAESFLLKKKKARKNADPILVCTVLWSTLIWQLIRELSASVCHLKKTAATWRGAHGSWAVTATADSKALSLLRTLLLPLWPLLDLSVQPSI